MSNSPTIPRTRTVDKRWTERNWTLPFVLIILFVNAIHVWALRWFLEPDGVSYLDIAWAYARGDARNAVNAFWSPLFSWLLAAVFRLLHPDRFRELAIVHALNFAAFMLALAAFLFLIREIQRWEVALPSPPTMEMLGPGALSLLSLAAFAYVSRYTFSPFIDQPDIFVEALVFADTALVVRIARGDRRARTFAIFGALLGVGYLTKTILFPLGIVFLACVFFAAGHTRRALAHTAIAAVMFLLISVPWIAAVSQKEGRPTIGTAGHIAYFVYSRGMDASDLWMGGPDGIAPLHPIRVALSSPPVLLFPSTQGTFPPWYDPSFYFAGAVNRFALRSQLRILRESFASFAQVLSEKKGPLIGLLVLFLFAGPRRYFGEFLRRWPLWLPSAAALGAYALVEFSVRLVEPFLLVLWLALLSAVCVPRSYQGRRLVSAIVAVVVLLLLFPLARAPRSDFAAIRAPFQPGEHLCGAEWTVAKVLRGMGLANGSHVAVVGQVRGHTDCWAALDGLTIIGEIPSSGTAEYWAASPDQQARILRIFASAGAIAAVTYTTPASAATPGWRRIGDSPYYVHLLATETAH